MLPFLFGMLAPSVLPMLGVSGLPPWLAGGLGALAGDVVDDGEIDPMNVLMGGLGGGLAGQSFGQGIKSLFGGTSAAGVPASATYGAAGRASALAPLSTTAPVARAAGQAAAKGGLGSLMSNPGMLMGGAALLSGMGGLEGGEPDKKSRTWRAQAPAPRPNSIAAPAPPTTVSTERSYGIQAPTIDEARDRYLAETAGARYVPRYADGGLVSQAPIGERLGNRDYLSSRPAMMPYDTNRIGGASANARMIQRGYNAGFGPRGLRTAGIASLPQTGSQRYVPAEYRSQAPTGKSSKIISRIPESIAGRMPSHIARNLGYADGGKVDGAIDTSMPEVQDAIAAIMGDPNVDPQQAMGRLYAKLRAQYGEEQADQMIKELVAMVEGSRAPDRRVPEAGGPDGMADDQMAMIDGQEPSRINSGEVVASVPTLAAMGNGDADKGADKLMAFMDDVRKEHYGRKEHPDRVDFEGMAARLA